MHDSIIRLEDVHLTLGEGASRVHVLDGASLTYHAGNGGGARGPSGSGKSTLLMVMAGLERADRGTGHRRGQRSHRHDEDGLAAFAAAISASSFQSFHLIANMTALENVAVPLELAGDRDAFDKARTRTATPSASAGAKATIPGSSRAASSSAWRSPGRSPPIR